MAQMTKDKIDTLERFKSKSVIVNPDISNVDVFSIVSNEFASYVNYIKVVNGSIVQGHTLEIKKKLDETEKDLLSLSIAELRIRYNSSSPEILVPFRLDLSFPDVKFTVPKIGDKKHLLLLSKKNAMQYMNERQLQMDKLDPSRKSGRILMALKKELNLKELPSHIECFDNSNIQGTTPVAAVSVFIDAKPAKKEYRHFNIKTVKGADDFASMEEIVYRRYRRLLEENKSLPQLIVIDGGKGQLSAAIKSLDKLELRGKIAIIGIAKKLEEIYYPNDPVPLYLDKKGDSLKLIQQLRDEVHRFAIAHHRKKEQKTPCKQI
jgi:excinuclease ABC subunit C